MGIEPTERIRCATKRRARYLEAKGPWHHAILYSCRLEKPMDRKNIAKNIAFSTFKRRWSQANCRGAYPPQIAHQTALKISEFVSPKHCCRARGHRYLQHIGASSKKAIFGQRFFSSNIVFFAFRSSKHFKMRASQRYNFGQFILRSYI